MVEAPLTLGGRRELRFAWLVTGFPRSRALGRRVRRRQAGLERRGALGTFGLLALALQPSLLLDRPLTGPFRMRLLPIFARHL
jgi:hypothetical protein